MNANKQMARFVDFINASSGVLTPLFEINDESLFGDWLQANWEILVETQVDAILQPYGDGADCNGASSRVWNPEALPTHNMMCLDKNTQEMEKFDRFVSIDEGKYSDTPPYSHVLTSRGTTKSLDVVDFIVEEMRSN